jgi:hypothetical protein
MSSSFPPETNGQKERVSQTMECYLPKHCNYEQDKWSEMLPTADYAYQHSLKPATGMSPFFANTDFDLRTYWPIEAAAQNLASRN